MSYEVQARVSQIYPGEEGPPKAMGHQEIPTLIGYLLTMGFAKQIKLKTVW